MKKGKRLLSAALCLAVAVSACLSSIVFADAAAPEGSYNEKSILSVDSNKLESNGEGHYTEAGAWDGYIQTSTDTETLESKYVCVKYKVSEGITVTDDTKVFNFQPFNTSWGGWDNNFVTIGMSDYDSETQTYTAYYQTEKIKQSLSSGTLQGFNISFNDDTKDGGFTLVDYRILSEKVLSSEEEYQLDAQRFILNITGTDLVAAGYDETALQNLIDTNSGNVTFYIHITEANEYSWLQARSGSVNKFNGNAADLVPGSGSGASNRYLAAKSCTKESGNAIQLNDEGQPLGKANTGNYAFPSCAITKSKITTVANYSLSIAIKTKQTEAEVLGFVFSDGTGVTVNSDGTLTMGFTKPVCEAATLDNPDEDSTQVWQQTADKRRQNLKLSLDYIAGMDSSKYTADSWSALQDALAVAQAEYDNASATANSLKQARDTLENVKAKLVFVTDTDDSNASEFRELSAEQTIAEMGVGTNLGNTLDGHSGFTPGETLWQSAVTTKEYIKALHDAGYNTLRIPVTWGNMIDDKNGYAINENWMSRVQDIVDYCVEQDMYAIINIHHDGAEQTGWLRVAADDIDSVMEKFEAAWRQIAEKFKDYDEHLIFESMNEITCGNGESYKNAADAVNYDTPIIVNFNQLFVNTVRSTGSNNAKRWLASVSHYANNGSSDLFTMPEDSYNDTNRQMFALHIYSDTNGVIDRIKKVASKFTSKGIPVYLGEYGRTLSTDSSTESGYNDVWRGWYSEVVGRACQVAGICPVVWDQGFGDQGELQTGLYSYWNRAELRPIFKSTIDKMVRGTFSQVTSQNQKYDFSDIDSGYNTVAATDITPSSESVTMNIGEYQTLTATATPSDSNDVVLWSTDNDKVATVFNGMIHAKGIGETTVHVYSQSGSVSKDIKVSVLPKASTENVTITTDLDTYEVVKDKGAYISAFASDGGALSFESTNNDIATVNDFGKIVGTGLGEAFVIITSDTGVTKTVKVVVKDALDTDEITVGIQVYYNDSDHSFWQAETGESITITGEGQYTLKFDCATDLSDKAISSGVTNLSNLTAIYLKDLTVDRGDAKASPLETCDITYDRILADGKELTITNAGPKSALKASGVFDTNDPVNAWDGSAVSEVTSNSDHVANFTTGKPTTFEVTFTLSNMKFKVGAATRENEASGLKAVSETEIKTCPNSDNKTAEITVKAVPRSTDSLVSFISSDKSVVLVDSSAVNFNSKTGEATASISIVGEGTATVTAITENGYTVEFTVINAHDYAEVSRTEPQVGVAGSVKYECSICGDSYEETLDPLPEPPTDPEPSTDPDEPTTGDEEPSTGDNEPTTADTPDAPTTAPDATKDQGATSAATTAKATTAQTTTAASGTASSDKPINTGAGTAVGMTAFMAAAVCGAIAVKRRKK